jgi:transcription antitermination factor NusG
MSDGMSDSVIRERKEEKWDAIGKLKLKKKFTVEVTETRVGQMFEVLDGPWAGFCAGSKEILQNLIKKDIYHSKQVLKMIGSKK